MKSKAKYYFSILTTSGVPIYRQIIDQVKTQIAIGKLKAGIFLPSVRQVAADLEINPMTVSKAYSLLEREGVLEYVRGQGMAVKSVQPSVEDLKGREDQIKPLLKQVIDRTAQLSLTPKKVIALLETLWKEPGHE